MILAILALAIVVSVAFEIIVPGQTVYHAGWFNVALLAVAIALVAQTKRRVAASNAAVRRSGILAIGAGACVLAFAAVASGLLAPDNRVVVGAPGGQIAVPDAGGTLVFPLVSSADEVAGDVQLSRGARKSAIGARRYAGSAILRVLPRRAVLVRAFDRRGQPLTVTQPNGIAFLSPLLLMRSLQTIAGMQLPYDAFAVPAVHRLVNAVLFSPEQAAKLKASGGEPVASVLFEAENDAAQPLSRGLAIARDGERVETAGMLLQPTVLAYPAVEVDAAPALLAVILGLLLVAGGAIILALGLRSARIV